MSKNINNQVAGDFFLLFNDSLVGVNGRTVVEEAKETTSMIIDYLYARNLYLACARPEVLDLYSKQGRNLARRAAELSKEDIEKLEARCLKLLKNAADKVLWLNSQCRDYMSEPFIVGYYNKRCVQDCHKLVLDFIDTVPTHEDVRITRLAF